MSSETRAAAAKRPRDDGWSWAPRGSQERHRLGWTVTLLGVALMLAGGAAGLLGGL
jgi:hypothetical protein